MCNCLAEQFFVIVCSVHGALVFFYSMNRLYFHELNFFKLLVMLIINNIVLTP